MFNRRIRDVAGSLKSVNRLFIKKSSSDIQSDLPIAIRSLATQLNMGSPFETALQCIADSNYRCSSEFQRVCADISNGSSVQDSLRQMGERIDSTPVRKILSYLVRAYENGTTGTDLKKQADELILIQKFKLKEFSAKLNLLGLIFIASACIVPTLFLAYGLVSAIYLGVDLGPYDIWLAFLGVFPVLNFLLVFYIYSKTPKILSTPSEAIFSSKERTEIESVLSDLIPNVKFDVFFKILILFSTILAVLSFFYVSTLGLFLLLVPVFVYFFILYLIDRKNKEIEQYLPDALFQVSTLEFGVPIEKIIQDLGSSNYGALSREFKKASNQIYSGLSVPSVLESITLRTSSTIFNRSISLIQQCYKSGKDVRSVIRDAAEDIFEINSLIKEQSTILTMQKYTILFGGCVLVPFILAFVLNILSGLDFSLISGVASMSESQRLTLLEAARDASKAYIVIFVLLASVFVAFQEGKVRKFVVYFSLFGLLSLGIFTYVLSNFVM